jgi:hypothetical protein
VIHDVSKVGPGESNSFKSNVSSFMAQFYGLFYKELPKILYCPGTFLVLLVGTNLSTAITTETTNTAETTTNTTIHLFDH